MDISTIGRYQILERLGQGGMGVVYRAFDPQIERTVAIKVISTQLVEQPEHRERFFREVARRAGWPTATSSRFSTSAKTAASHTSRWRTSRGRPSTHGC